MQNDITLPNFSVKIGQTKMSLDADLRDLIEDILLQKHCGIIVEWCTNTYSNTVKYYKYYDIEDSYRTVTWYASFCSQNDYCHFILSQYENKGD